MWRVLGHPVCVQHKIHVCNVSHTIPPIQSRQLHQSCSLYSWTTHWLFIIHFLMQHKKHKAQYCTPMDVGFKRVHASSNECEATNQTWSTKSHKCKRKKTTQSIKRREKHVATWQRKKERIIIKCYKMSNKVNKSTYCATNNNNNNRRNKHQTKQQDKTKTRPTNKMMPPYKSHIVSPSGPFWTLSSYHHLFWDEGRGQSVLTTAFVAIRPCAAIHIHNRDNCQSHKYTNEQREQKRAKRVESKRVHMYSQQSCDLSRDKSTVKQTNRPHNNFYNNK